MAKLSSLVLLSLIVSASVSPSFAAPVEDYLPLNTPISLTEDADNLYILYVGRGAYDARPPVICAIPKTVFREAQAAEKYAKTTTCAAVFNGKQ